jgi:hypothetical protein
MAVVVVAQTQLLTQHQGVLVAVVMVGVERLELETRHQLLQVRVIQEEAEFRVRLIMALGVVVVLVQ